MVGPATDVMAGETGLTDEGLGVGEAIFVTVGTARGAMVDGDFRVGAVAWELEFFHGTGGSFF